MENPHQIITINQLPEILQRQEERIQCLESKIEKLSRSPEEEPPIDIYAAARQTHLSVATIYAKSSKREIPCHKVGKRLLFYKSELNTWIKNSRSRSNELINQLLN